MVKIVGLGVNGRMWCIIKKIYESSKSVVFLEEEKSDVFNVEQGVAQDYSSPPPYFQYSLMMH